MLGVIFVLRFLHLRWNTGIQLQVGGNSPTFPCWLRVYWERATSRVATTRRLPYQANGLLYPGGLLITPPLQDCLTGLKGSSTQAGTGSFTKSNISAENSSLALFQLSKKQTCKCSTGIQVGAPRNKETFGYS